MARISNYLPDTNDQELLDFVSDVTAILNRGVVSFPTSSTPPTSTSNASEGERRLVRVSTYDVRAYSLVNGAWYYSQMGRPSLSGWGYIQVSGTPASQTQAVSFGVTFSSPPFVMISYIGNISGAAPTAPEAFTSALTLRMMVAYAPTTTGFTAGVFTTNASALVNGDYEGFAWQAFYD